MYDIDLCGIDPFQKKRFEIDDLQINCLVRQKIDINRHFKNQMVLYFSLVSQDL